MARLPIPTWCFSVVVVRKGDQYLIVQESKHEQRWYLPAGRVEPGESFAEAALRETYEESGLNVKLLGVLRFEHSPKAEGARLRVIFLAEPIDNTAPKSVPDDESLAAAWVSLSDLTNYPLRSKEVIELFQYVDRGGNISPLNIIQREGMAFKNQTEN
ncbi:MAG: NUDIX hydrolase [bacterium]